MKVFEVNLKNKNQKILVAINETSQAKTCTNIIEEGNLEKILSILKRNFKLRLISDETEGFQKFLLKELATSGVRDGDKLVLNNKIPSAKINPKIERYAKEFVICHECGKPDTEIVKDSEHRMNFLHCLACGAKHPIRWKI